MHLETDDNKEEEAEDWNRLVNNYKVLRRKKSLSDLTEEDWRCLGDEYKELRKKRQLDNKKRSRDSSSDDSSSNEYEVLRKKQRLDSNELKKGGKYVSQQKIIERIKR